jgi:hypothetical protein
MNPGASIGIAQPLAADMQDAVSILESAGRWASQSLTLGAMVKRVADGKAHPTRFLREATGLPRMRWNPKEPC